MAGISEQDIQKVREASDIVAVFGERTPVKQKGRDFWCCCPIHEEKTPSCKLDPASQLWHCFGCGAGGDIFSFIMQVDDLSFPEAVRKLADRANIPLVETDGKPGVDQGYKTRLKLVCKESADFFHTRLMRGKDASAAAARSYLARRNFGGSIPKEWKLGFAVGDGSLISHLRAKGFTEKELIDANVGVGAGERLRERFYGRVMFPICDVQGEVIAFGGRIIGDGQPKYLNSQETPIFHKSEVLYGLDKAKAAMASNGSAVVVEGYTDVIALHAAGIKNVVATLGTSLTRQHIRVLSRHARKRIVYLFDGDEAGRRAADRALEFIDASITPEAGRTKIDLMAITLPDNLDPADFVVQRGAVELGALLENAESLLSYGIERRLAKHDLISAEGRSRALNDALSILIPIKDSLLAKDYAVQIAGRVGAREDDVLAHLARLKETPRQSNDDGDFARQSVGRIVSTLSEAEKNRRRFEREFLSLCAYYPEIALARADVLAQARWHEPVHASLAESLLSTLAQKPDAGAAELVSAAQNTIPAAAGILTSGVLTRNNSPEALVVFLAEELGMGDAEDEINALKQQLKNPRDLSYEEQELLFTSVVSMQKDLAQRRTGHKPIVE